MSHKILEVRLCLIDHMVIIISKLPVLPTVFFSGKLSEKGILSCFCGSGGE